MKKLMIVFFCLLFQFSVVSSSYAGWFDDVVDWFDDNIVEPVEEAANDVADWFENAGEDVMVGLDYVAEAIEVIGDIGENVFIGLYNDTQKLLGIYDDGTDEEYLESWTVKAMTMQTRLDKYAPLNKANMPHTHNAFNSEAYMTTISYLDPNQKLSMLNQLNVGIRTLELDLHWFNSDVILCHNGGSGLCSSGDRSFAEGLEEIRYWFMVEDHKANDVVILRFEDHLDGHYGDAVADIEALIGDLVYQPEISLQDFQDMAAVKTKADILAEGKNIILIGANSTSVTKSGYGDYVHTSHHKSIKYKNLTTYPDCYDGSSGPYDIQNSVYRAYNDGTELADVIDADDMTVEDVEIMTKCGINAIGPEPLEWWDSRHEAQIWSWNVDEPNDWGGNEDCAEQNSGGRFNDIDCDSYRSYACQNPESRDWQITYATGVWNDGDSVCNDEFGAEGYIFSLPANGYENAQLEDAKIDAGVNTVWLNYSDVKQEGNWVPHSNNSPVENLAFGKETTQSSTGWNGVSSRAVDGNTNGNYSGGNSITHTQNDNNAWWQVDLGVNSEISEIVINNRTDCCSTRLSNFYVLISEDSMHDRSLNDLLSDASVESVFYSGSVNIVTNLPVSAEGRFVKVQLSGQNYLSLAEVQVFGYEGEKNATSLPISLSGAHNKYFVAESNGGKTVNANRSAIGSWERFTLIGPSSWSDCIVDGDTVNILTGGGKFFSAQSNGNLDADRSSAGTWETFTLINHSDPVGCLENGDIISLKSYHNKYVVAESNGDANANRSSIGSWEKIKIVLH